MKYFIIFTTFIIAANAALDPGFVSDLVGKVKNIGQQCVTEVSASSDDVSSILAHKVPTTKEGKCLIFCVHKGFHVQNSDGSIDRAGTLQFIEPLKSQDADIYEKVLNAVKTCEGTPVDSDPCEYAAKLAECGLKEGKAAGLTDLIILEID